jgi:hypothetical protein
MDRSAVLPGENFLPEHGLPFQLAQTKKRPEAIMNHRPKAPEPKPQRVARRKRQPGRDRAKEEQNRRRSLGGGQPNELGVVQGQNGEQGNSTVPANSQDIGRQSH